MRRHEDAALVEGQGLAATMPFRVLPAPVYTTRLGACYVGDSLELLKRLPDDCVDLVLTSPLFGSLWQGAQGHKDQSQYVEWLSPFGAEVRRVVRETGSFVLHLGGAYQRGAPVRSLYQYRVLLKMCDEIGFYLAEEFFWYKPAKLASTEWVNRRKLRVKDAVDTVWWLSKSKWPKADVRRVLVPYSEAMRAALKKGVARLEVRPSGRRVWSSFLRDNGGAIPSNLLQIAISDSNSPYVRLAKLVRAKIHPARFPAALPNFFIKFLTEEGDLVVDIFAGSNTTGRAAEQCGRRWIAMELDAGYIAGSALRFMDHLPEREAAQTFARLLASSGKAPVDLSGPPTLFDRPGVGAGGQEAVAADGPLDRGVGR